MPGMLLRSSYHFVWALSVTFWVVSSSMSRATEPLPASVEAIDYAKHVKPFFAEYCFECHSDAKQKADVNLESYSSAPEMYQQRRFWSAVRDMLENHEMPPSKKAQPSETDRKMIVRFVDYGLEKFNCDGEIDPGRVTIRRLNRSEYRNTLRDLLGITVDAAAELPLDEVGYGFDNIGDVLSLSPMLFEKYLAATGRVVAQAIVTDETELIPRFPLSGAALKSLSGENVRLEDEQLWGFWREGEAVAEHNLPSRGEYEFRIEAYGDQAGPEAPKLSVRVDGAEVRVFDVAAKENNPETYRFKMALDKGNRKLTFAYLNNYNSSGNADPLLNGDRNLFVKTAELVGPLDGPAPQPPLSHQRIIPRKPAPGEEAAFSREVLARFASKAFRRPVSPDVTERLGRLADMARADGHSFESGIQIGVAATLVSPQFLFRWELDPGESVPGEPRALDGYELASRLSYFLWSSMPDDELFQLAAENRLHKPAVLEAQVRRMMRDPKASALVENFAGQWLQVRNFESTPDPDRFPTFDEGLRKAMKSETKHFFESIMTEDRTVLEFLDADYTFVNERLARHYGIPGVQGEEFRRVSLTPELQRGGILGQASILTLTSNPSRTSPVSRGKWILEQLLGAPPPPPPPGVPLLQEGKGVDFTASLRKRMEQHRENPDCATCHDKMDPLGFAFEKFDAIGAWREKDGEFDIDPSGRMPDGRQFNGPRELKAILKGDDRFVRTLSGKLLTYALGRGLEYYDKCAVDAIVEQLKQNDHRFSALVLGVINSRPFQMRTTSGDQS